MDADTLVSRLAGAIRREKEKPAGEVIAEEVWLAVVEGELSSGERLPTVRKLAIELGVSPRTVERAYDELERLGVASTRTGTGTFVAVNPPPEAERARRRRLQALCRQVISDAAELDFTLDELLEALAEYRSVELEEPST